jgi:cobalt-zinc-cadmium efflux system membrane fusion protein
MTRFLIPAFILVAAAAGCSRSAEPPPAAIPPPAEKPANSADHDDDASEVRIEEGMLRDLRITTAAVESRRGDERVSLLGELAVDESTYAEVGVAVPARVVLLRAGPGDVVRPGQPLADVESTDVGRARADYLAAVARQTLADTSLQRKRELAGERIAPQREVQEAEAAAAAARADVRAALAALSAMGVATPDAGGDGDDAARAALFSITSPVGGTVIERRAVRGQMLDPSTPAFKVAQLATLWLTVHAFERDALRIQQGSTARVTFAALPAQEFDGRVTLVGRQVSSDSRTVDVRVEVRNRGNLLRPGMSGSATMPIGDSATPTLTVPIAAVQRVGEGWCVFVPKAAGVFEIRRIGRGRDLGGEIEVLSGLTAGDTIVVNGAFLLKSQAEKADAGHGHGGH